MLEHPGTGDSEGGLKGESVGEAGCRKSCDWEKEGISIPGPASDFLVGTRFPNEKSVLSRGLDTEKENQSIYSSNRAGPLMRLAEAIRSSGKIASSGLSPKVQSTPTCHSTSAKPASHAVVNPLPSRNSEEVLRASSVSSHLFCLWKR